MDKHGFILGLRLQEPVHNLDRVTLGRNRDELVAKITQHGLMPMQGIWWANRPISSQPEGQVAFRAVCGVAALANSQLLAAHRALQPIPKSHLRGPIEIVNRL
ncbi:hypothetical protein [Polaromonas sp. UC242_47]|uniref:hypothetical protein n=1 Tax=Polaromonas sp. UC242_47 TaxID=3374626 RepID=UPI0037B150BE